MTIIFSVVGAGRRGAGSTLRASPRRPPHRFYKNGRLSGEYHTTSVFRRHPYSL